jgi:beta-glucanase (GH16 family)
MPANVEWFDSGVALFGGEAVSISASGTVTVGSLNGAYNDETPAGQPGVTPLGGAVIAPNSPAWSLIGRIGASGLPFEIGTGVNFAVPAIGELYLSVNDNYFPDNAGTWSVTINVTGGPVLVWGDEFNGAGGSLPDPTKWTYDLGRDTNALGTNGWGNNELETYTNGSQNAYLDGSGHLVISALNPVSGYYASARMKTAGLFSTRYGMIEASMELPVGAGLWPAFWMLGTNITSAGWPECGEIDMMENVLTNGGCAPYYPWIGTNHIQSTIHGPQANSVTNDFDICGSMYDFNTGDSVENYHIYGAIWSPVLVQFFVDNPGNVFATFTSNEVVQAGGQWVFDHPFYILLNLAVGGNWPGSPNATTPFPANISVDYVRVYQWNMASITPPTLVITSPTPSQHMTNALAYVVGTANDSWQVVGVWYQLNSGSWNSATTTNNFTNWTATLELTAGTNTVNAFDMDPGGISSTVASVSVVSSNTFKLQLALTNSHPLTSTGLVFTLQISPNMNGHIQVSTNLTSWVTLTNFVGTNSTLTIRDPAATNYSRRFYRAVIP